MELFDDIVRTTSRPRRWLAALACALLLGQSLAVAHTLDAQAHADERACELCHVANELTGAAPAVDHAPVGMATVSRPVVVHNTPGLARDASLLPPSRAPPLHLAFI